MSIKVFVSSTYRDLKPERQAVERAIHRLQAQFKGMEYFGSREETPKETCLAEVESSDIYVGIVAHRYGSIDPETGLSMTELEYERAGECDIERLIYIKSDEVPVPHTEEFMDFDPEKQRKLREFKARLLEVHTGHTVTFFTSPDNLAASVTADLARRLMEPNLDEMRANYLAFLAQRYEYLDLGGIAPRVQNRTVKLRMEDIFVPIEARPEISARGRWEALQTLLAQGGRPEEALSLLREFFERRGSEAARLPELARVLEEAGDTEAALRTLRELTARGGWPPELPKEAAEPATIADLLSTPRAVVLGDPGTGKSTLLKYVAYAIAAGLSELVGEDVMGRLPILVRIIDYARARQDDPTLRLRDYVRDLHDRDRAPLFRHALEAGQCLVMLDGLDEVIDPHERGRVADEIEALVADYPDNQYLITSRIVGYEAGRLTGDFTHYTISPLPPESIADFVPPSSGRQELRSRRRHGGGRRSCPEPSRNGRASGGWRRTPCF